MSDVAISGNLTADPVHSTTDSGVARVTFSIAVNRKFGDNKESVSFFQVIAWRFLADHAIKSLHKGQRILVIGRLDQSSWEDEQGQRQSRVQITADDFGHSLRFGTSEFTKSVRSNGDSAS